jgi:fatty acyl-CoA reductase
MSPLRPPNEGWVNNLNGPAGVAVSGGLCLLGRVICHTEKAHEVVPVDCCANLLLSSAWYIANYK